jgi:pimeloyl-ACP methyl ester carboxylesterase
MREDRYAAASLMRLAPVNAPQTLLIGAKDATFGPVGRAYFARARAVGDSTTRLIELPESGHFEMIDPGSSSWPEVYGAFKASLTQDRRSVKRTGSHLSASHWKTRFRTAH